MPAVPYAPMSTADPTSHSLISQRLKLHYVDWGNPTAPPLLLIHGGRDHCRSWDWVAARLRALGAGNSTTNTRGYFRRSIWNSAGAEEYD